MRDPRPVESDPAAPIDPTRTVSALSGVAFMLVSTLLFAAMHGSIRHVAAGGIHPFEIAFFRNLFALLVVLPWFVRHGLGPLRTRRIGLHALRAVFNIVAMLSFFYALTVAPLAEVTALGFTAPIFATVLAVLVLGEVVGVRRWGAVVVGFVGTVIILRPGFETIGLGQSLTLLSSLAWAWALMVIKVLSRTDSSVTIVTWMALSMIPLSAVPAAFVWHWPDGGQLLWLVLIGLLGGSGQYCVAEALRRSDAGLVMPVDFCKLLWVSVIAWLAFGEVADLYTWLGGAVIFASTVYIAYRERAVTRPSSPRAAR